MTRARMFGRDTEFCEWLRKNPNLPSCGRDFGFVATDNDLTVHRYKTSTDGIGTRSVQGMMIIEVKTNGKRPDPSQVDTLSKLNLFSGWKTSGITKIWFFGVFGLVLSGTDPTNSDYMEWGIFPEGSCVQVSDQMHWRSISESELIELLRFERHPRNPPNTCPFRRHHKTAEFVELEATPLGFLSERIVRQRS